MSHGENRNHGRQIASKTVGPIRIAATTIIMLLVTGTFLTFCSNAALGAPGIVPVLSIMIASPEGHANVTDVDNATVRFNGTVSVDKLPVERCVVTLNESMDTGWISNISPDTMVFTSTTPQPFCVTVNVPAGTPHNRTGNLVVTGFGKAYDVQLSAEAKATVHADPFYKIFLCSTRSSIQIDQGGQGIFVYLARNGGNDVDSYEVAIASTGSLANTGWKVVPGERVLSNLRPNESRPVRISVQSIGSERFPRDHSASVVVRLTSLNAGALQQTVSQTIQFTVQVKAIWLPSLSPYLLILALSTAAAYLLRPRAGPVTACLPVTRPGGQRN